MAVLARRCRAALPERLGAVGCHIGWEKVGQKYNGTAGPPWRIEDHEPPSKRLQTAYSLTAAGVTPPVLNRPQSGTRNRPGFVPTSVCKSPEGRISHARSGPLPALAAWKQRCWISPSPV